MSDRSPGNGVNPPPCVYTRVDWDKERRILSYEYAGRIIVTIAVTGEEPINFRAGSDSTIQTAPLIQQTFVSMDSGVASALVTFHLDQTAVAMRPQRADREEAVLGTVGGRLPHGVNGIYHKASDFLMDWHGRPWRWVDEKIHVDEGGAGHASLEVELGPEAWILNLRPQYYRRHLGYERHRPWERMPNQKAVAGWCSWEAFRREVTAEHIRETAQFVAEHFKDYGLEYVQIDDGYQRRPITIGPQHTLADAWLATSESFPDGLSAIARDISELGLEPGIWLSADIEQIDPDEDGTTCQLMRPDGTPLKAFWMRAVLDCKPDTLARHVRPLCEGMREAGFRYVKIDQIRHLLTDALQEAVRQGILDEDDARDRFLNFMRATRDGLGPDTYYLASWGVITEVMGCADACRIAQDANPQWSAIRMQIAESARWFHAQRVLFLNDPDHVCVRTNPEWARSLLSLVSLSGQLFMLSDPVGDYDDTRVKLIQKCLPPLTTTTAETGPIDMHYPAFTWIKQHGAEFQGELERDWHEVSDEEARVIAGYHATRDAQHPLSSLWAFHLAAGRMQWCVAIRIAVLPLNATRLPLTALGLDPERSYLAFDFWAERFLGEVSEAVEVQALPLGHCQVLAFRERLNRPQFLAGSRHVSMGAVSVACEAWTDNVLTLKLRGVPGTTETYWVHVPAGCELINTRAKGADVTPCEQSNGIVALSVEFTATQADIKLPFR